MRTAWLVAAPYKPPMMLCHGRIKRCHIKPVVSGGCRVVRPAWRCARLPGHHGRAIPLHLVPATTCVGVLLLIKNNDFGLDKISEVKRSSRMIIPVNRSYINRRVSTKPESH